MRLDPAGDSAPEYPEGPEPLTCLAHGCDEWAEDGRAYCAVHSEHEDAGVLKQCACPDCAAKERAWQDGQREHERSLRRNP